MSADRTHDREVLALAVPAFFALIAEPLYLLADSAIVGHLGTTQLAGLGIAGTIVTFAVGLCIFLAYGTTATVARSLGAGDTRGALDAGIDGMWLATGLGIVLAILGLAAGHLIVGWFDPSPAIAVQATRYLRVAVLGIPAVLVLLAATGVLRGLQDTRTPLMVAVATNALNVGLNTLLVYGVGMGIAGSATGTVVSQWAGACWMTALVGRHARRAGAALTPDRVGIRSSARCGAPLVIRSLSLQIAILATTALAARIGSGRLQAVQVAAHQIVITLWYFLAFALDALAIAGQALTGRTLGAGDVATTRSLTSRITRWGIVVGSVLGLAVIAGATLIAGMFTSDPDVVHTVVRLLRVAGLGLPLAGLVYVLDGILIGAGDGRFLARAQVASLAAYLPIALVVALGLQSLTMLWAAFAIGWVCARALQLEHRRRGGRWMVTGAP